MVCAGASVGIQNQNCECFGQGVALDIRCLKFCDGHLGMTHFARAFLNKDKPFLLTKISIHYIISRVGLQLVILSKSSPVQ